MGNTEQFSEEYLKGFEDAKKGSMILSSMCVDIDSHGPSVAKTIVSRITEMTPENYRGWAESIEKSEAQF